MPEVSSKKELDENVLDAALRRIRTIYDRFDTVRMFASGGKDSTVTMNLLAKVARERGRAPLTVVFLDEEIIPPDVDPHLRRIREERDDINLRWIAPYHRHANGFSYSHKWWYPWNPDARDKWVRERPDFAETEDDFDHWVETYDIEDLNHVLWTPSDGLTAHVIGIRAQESMRRHRVILMGDNDGDHYLSEYLKGAAESTTDWAGKGMVHLAYPIYDWKTRDIWQIYAQRDWDYAETYDLKHWDGMNIQEQRVTIAVGSRTQRSLEQWPRLYPKYWNRLIKRIPGAHATQRYGGESIYGRDLGDEPPGELDSWRDYFEHLLKQMPNDTEQVARKSVAGLIESHNSKSRRKISDEKTDLITGASWKYFCKVALAAPHLEHREGQMAQQADRARNARDMDFEDAIKLHGTPEFKQKRLNE